MGRRTFATAINCMDGRVQEPVVAWMKQQLKVDYVDMITEPGPDKIMTVGPSENIESIKQRVTISVNAHGSRVVAIFAHDDCTGYPVSKEEHLSALSKCVDMVKSWMFPVRILGLWINADSQVEQIIDSQE